MNKNILLNDVRMDTQTAFFMNGDINIYPCPYEQDKALITSESKASYRGRITVMENGKTEVKRYNLGSQLPIYQKLSSIRLPPYGRLNDKNNGTPPTTDPIWDEYWDWSPMAYGA